MILLHKELRSFSTMRTEVSEEEISQFTFKRQEGLCFVVALVCFISSTILLLSLLLFAHGRVFFLWIFWAKKEDNTTLNYKCRSSPPRFSQRTRKSLPLVLSRLPMFVEASLFVSSKPARPFNIPKAHNSFIKG